MGVHVYVSWTDVINFKAEFYLTPLTLCGGALSLTQAAANTAVTLNGPPASEFSGGPYAKFDSLALSIDVSAKLTLLGVSSSVVVKVDKTQCAFSTRAIFGV
jgi:hypothetical protein